MRARGYGLRGRTAYTIFRFTASDAVVLVLTLLLASAVLVLTLVGDVNYAYYPTLGTVGHGAADLALYAALTLLCGGSILMEVKETILWHTLRSSI
jgi:energy-coupling factor transport system permease protein